MCRLDQFILYDSNLLKHVAVTVLYKSRIFLYYCNLFKYVIAIKIFVGLFPEPFNLTNTARAVYDANIYNRILRVFRESYKQLRKTGDLQSILDHPY